MDELFIADDDYTIDDTPVEDIIEQAQTRPKRKKAKTPGIPAVTPRQKELVHSYLNKDSSTYSNKVQSFAKVYHKDLPLDSSDPQYANIAQQAYTAFRTHSLTTYMESLLETQGLGVVDRISAIRNIVQGEYTQTTMYTDADGNVKSRILTTPSASQVLKGVEELNKMSGLYEHNRATADVQADALKTLRREMLRQFREAHKEGKGVGVPKDPRGDI